MAELREILGGTRSEISSLSWDDYKRYPGLNPSTIKAGRESMLALKYVWDHGGLEDTPSMSWGRAMHTLLFEPSHFSERYCAYEGRRAGNKYQEFADEAQLLGKEILPAHGPFSQEYALNASQQFLKNRLVQDLIVEGVAEQGLFVVEDGLQCRGRVDWIRTREPHKLVDMKTTRSIRYFSNDFYRLGYDLQLSLYHRWLKRLMGADLPVEVVVLENHPPFDSVVIPIDPAVLHRGERLGMDIIHRVKQCILEDRWPGMAEDDLYVLNTPLWAMDDELEGAELIEGAA